VGIEALPSPILNITTTTTTTRVHARLPSSCKDNRYSMSVYRICIVRRLYDFYLNLHLLPDQVALSSTECPPVHYFLVHCTSLLVFDSKCDFCDYGPGIMQLIGCHG